MALLWCDGFEGYGASDADPSPVGVFADKYAQVSGENEFTTLPTSGRNGGASIKCSAAFANFYIRTGNLTSNATTFMGVAYYYEPQTNWESDTRWSLFRYGNSGGNWCGSLVVTDASLWFRNAAAAYVGGSRVTLERYKYNYIEAKVFSHATAGTVEVRVNGCPVMNLTSVNTQASGGVISNFGIGFPSPIQNARNSRLDDYYVCDASGSENNDFLGDTTVRTLWPDGDDSVNFTTTGNGSYATHYEQVNGLNSLRSTDYVDDGSAGAKDIFTLDDSTDNFATVHAVVGWAYGNYVTTPNNYRLVCDSNGTESESSNITGSSSWEYDSYILESDPDTAGAWTDSTVNALKYGFEVQ
jgi:hypothetical protein